MHSQFIKYIEANSLIAGKAKVLLSVSGGIDSMVMADLFRRTDYPFAIAHCNFQLRGKESDSDEDFVRNYSTKNKIDFYTKRFKTSEYASENHFSVQMAARRLRRHWFNQLLKDNEFDVYATAHHLDDQIETFFINLLRGTGISGLHGILPKQGRLIHPMLFTYRENILAYAKANKIEYREDSSNKKTDYTRNKIRHFLLPQVEKIEPGYRKILDHNIGRIREVEAIYSERIQKVCQKIVHKESDFVYIDVNMLGKLSQPKTYLFEIIKEYGFSFADANKIAGNLESISGKQYFSPTHRITKDRSSLIIDKYDISVHKTYSIEKGEEEITVPLHLQIQEFTRPAKLIIPSGEAIALIDNSKLKFPLLLRRWKKGDFFYPLGMSGKKLLSDYFVDNKFSQPQKERTWLLTSADNIIWIIGHRIDNRYKITPETSRIIHFRLIETEIES